MLIGPPRLTTAPPKPTEAVSVDAWFCEKMALLMLALLWRVMIAPPSVVALLLLNVTAEAVEPRMVRTTAGNVTIAPPWIVRLVLNRLSFTTRQPALATMAPPSQRRASG